MASKDYKQFVDFRLSKHFARLEAMNFNFRVTPAFEIIDTMVIGSKFTYEPKSVIPGSKIYYTLNGRNPTDADWEYQSPLTFKIPANEKRELKTTVITPNGRRSLSTRTLMFNKAYLAPTNLQISNPGLNFKLFKGTFIVPEQLDKLLADSVGVARMRARNR